MTQEASYDYFGNEHVFDERDYIPHVSVYGVYVIEDKVLMVQDSKSGRWEFPGGGIEKGEKETAGLIREVYEETGLIVAEPFKVIKKVIEFYYDLPTQEPWKSTRKFLLIKNVSGEILFDGNDDDTSAVRMVSNTEIKNLNATEIVKGVLSVIL